MDHDELIVLDGQPLEVRDLEKREIVGRVVPYGEQIQIRGRPESFAPGALRDIKAGDVKLLLHHDQKRPVGKMTALEERSDGAYGVFRVSKTQAGNDALEEASDGLLSFSPGFFAGDQTQQGVHTRVRAMPEVSLVTFSAYKGSQVLAVREKEGVMPEVTETETEPVVTPEDIAALEKRQEEIADAVERMEVVLNAPSTRSAVSDLKLKPFDWFVGQVNAEFRGKDELLKRYEEDFSKLQTRMESGELETRALADVTGGEVQAGDNSPADDLSGLVVQEFMASQLVNLLNTRRPVFRNLGSIPMPRSGYATIPTVTQHTVVAARGDQKTEVPSQKMITTNADFKAQWLAGAVDVAIELIRTAELPVLDLVWNDLLGQYAKATELDPTHGAVPVIEAGGHGFTYTGTALDVTDYPTFIDDVITQADAVEDGSDAPAEVLLVTRAQFRTILGFVDANDRRLFSMLGSQNADGRAPLNAQAIELPGGITVIKARSDAFTQAILTNRESIRVSDGGPERVEATNVALMGRDIGILGRVLFVPRIPAGVVVFGVDPVS